MNTNLSNTQAWTNSLFIPRIDFEITKPALKKFFEVTYPCGNVSRIDYVAFNTDKGSGRRAFVHFSDFSNTSLKETLIKKGKCDVCMNGHHLRLVINDKPVPETNLNLNQVAHNTEFLGEEMKIQQEQMEEMQEKLKAMEKWKEETIHQINSMVNTMNHLTEMNMYLQSQLPMYSPPPMTVSLTSVPYVAPPPTPQTLYSPPGFQHVPYMPNQVRHPVPQPQKRDIGYVPTQSEIDNINSAITQLYTTGETPTTENRLMDLVEKTKV